MSTLFFLSFMCSVTFFSLQIICQTMCWMLGMWNPWLYTHPHSHSLFFSVPSLVNRWQHSSAITPLMRVYIIRCCWLREGRREVPSTGLSHGNSPTPHIFSPGELSFLFSLGTQDFFLFSFPPFLLVFSLLEMSHLPPFSLPAWF